MNANDFRNYEDITTLISVPLSIIIAYVCCNRPLWKQMKTITIHVIIIDKNALFKHKIFERQFTIKTHRSVLVFRAKTNGHGGHISPRENAHVSHTLRFIEKHVDFISGLLYRIYQNMSWLTRCRSSRFTPCVVVKRSESLSTVRFVLIRRVVYLPISCCHFFTRIFPSAHRIMCVLDMCVK